MKLHTGSVYEGFWDMGIRNGDGNLFMPGGDYYLGSWQSGFFNEGTVVKSNGTRFAGKWSYQNLVIKFKGRYSDEEKEGDFDIQMNDLKTFLTYGN